METVALALLLLLLVGYGFFTVFCRVVGTQALPKTGTLRLNLNDGLIGVGLLVAMITATVCLLVACVDFGPRSEIPFIIAFGWHPYLVRVLTQIRPDPWAVATGIVCLAGVIFGTHAFFRWLASSAERPWRWKWTWLVLGVIVLMFVAGVAFTGLIHQTIWLIRSPEPFVGLVFGR